MIVGFTNMLVGLWDQERPRSVLVGFDSLDTPTYRHEEFPAYQSGRVFEEDLLEQLDLLPELVATSDRDLFQLASERTTILAPTRGVSEISRIGPAEVRERYGVEPKQVPDFIALRGDPSDRLPGAKGVGPKTAASVLAEHGTLESALEAGRFAAQAEELRLYRRIATVDASAPLPPLGDQTPTWAEASALVERWGLRNLSGRLAERA
jgi:DNA polymerase-1